MGVDSSRQNGRVGMVGQAGWVMALNGFVAVDW